MENLIDIKAKESLKYYVYCLIDPLTRDIFYIGKGVNGRVDSHEFETSEKAKNQRIKKIEKKGMSVEKIIIIHGLDEDDALRIESTLITLLNVKKDMYNKIDLLNIQGGHHQNMMCLSVEDINAMYGSKPLSEIEIKHNVLCINVNKTYSQTFGLIGEERKKHLYYITRGNWVKLSKWRAEQQDLVFSEYNGVVRAIYKPTKWIYDIDDDDFRVHANPDDPRLCFVGVDVTEEYPEYLYINLEKKPKTTSRFKYLTRSSEN